ncbi:phospholipase D family protein [Vibrio sinaloensis]|uniref:phospholipase D family protein n=1 Tax=Photobacterium sp. (strain ATCC 43367) TaxID=379097 RepID=UPI00057EF611|nr:phospholipase D family protein [Vibrio sinaloensis]KHT50480.1 hydrolase [Vibrio sinaloensis]
MIKLRRLASQLFIVSLLAGCGTLPDDIVHTPSTAPLPSDTQLSKLNDQYWKDRPEVSSAVLLQESGWDALAQRLALVETAERTIDIQYYIWNSDVSGAYLASRLLAAADRGVKVRVMLDDINLNERESLLIELNAHPNVEIRVFNPIPTRRGVAKWLNVLGDFSRLNRRMHNKSFTVDGAFSVIGGRNIGDEYFDLSDDINFRDRDALVMGDVVEEVQTSFNQYWDSRWSYPVDLLGEDQDVSLSVLKSVTVPEYLAYPPLPSEPMAAKQLLTQLTGSMTPVQAHYIADRPVPSDESNTSEPKRTAKYLSQLAEQSHEEVLLESAYLVFDDRQLNDWQTLNERGVDVKALTNSMASNDLVTNHSAYAGRREDMLQHGVQLFELQPDSSLCFASTKDNRKCAPEASYGLHSKSAVFDKQVAVIGSFNFNLRSTYLNSESILVIDSPVVAEELAETIGDAMDETHSWSLHLHEGDVYWQSGERRLNREPDTGKWPRFQSYFLQLLPIEKYL